MGTYFLDTSAIVKRYVVETGQAWVAALCAPSSANTIIISQAALVEAVAMFCRKAREADTTKRISEAERDRIIALFRQDMRRHYSVVQVTTNVYTHAGDLCRPHKLRAYDAVQLACALTVRDKLATVGIAPTFVCADADLLSVAAMEGLSTENPNAHP